MSNQEYTHVALGGIVREASMSPDGAREIQDFEVHNASLVSAEQALHPTWRNLEGRDFTSLSWSLTEHPLPGCEITTVVKEIKEDA